LTDIQIRRFNEASDRYEAGEQREALHDLDNLIGELTDPKDKAGPIYHRVQWLLDQGDIPGARRAMEEMKSLVALFADSPPDTDHLDEVVGLSVMALDAEAEVLAQEGDASAALQIIQTMEARYPKYLLLPEFGEMHKRIRGLRAFFLTALGRCEEAIPLFENSTFPEGQSGEVADNLGYCYYRRGNYARARQE